MTPVAVFRAWIADSLGVEVAAMAPLGGGDVADAYRVDLVDGVTVFAKTKADAVAGFFTTEAAGLVWLRDAGAVAVPEVLAVSDDPPFLVQEWIEPGYPAPTTEEDLGSSLAALHRSGAPHFGREDRRTTGSRGLPNEPSSSWADFLAQQRLVPLVELASRDHILPMETIAGIELVAERIERYVGPDEPPSRLHGDLWAGNRLVGREGVSWLIDPAAFGGHREFDIAMMHLFGGFGHRCFAAYNDAFPLAQGWEQRIPLHQLPPLIVHAIKFGGPYVAATRDALNALS